MKFWLKLIGVFFIFSLSGCGLLLKNRMTNHHGIAQDQYNLPVIVYSTFNPLSKRILFLFSGDGGWIDFEDKLATEYSKRGFYVVGFNSRTYFWAQKTPQQMAEDVSLLITQYNDRFKTNRVYLSGYSFGGDVLPFLYNNLPASIKDKVVALQLLSPFASTDFKVHTTDLLNIAEDNRDYKVGPEVEKIKIPIYCFYGSEEIKPLEAIKIPNFKLMIIPGGHHYEEAGYAKILSSLRPLRPLRFFHP